eukprot:1601949-Pleurochrysis_carterae.AAC.1
MARSTSARWVDDDRRVLAGERHLRKYGLGAACERQEHAHTSKALRTRRAPTRHRRSCAHRWSACRKRWRASACTHPHIDAKERIDVCVRGRARWHARTLACTHACSRARTHARTQAPAGPHARALTHISWGQLPPGDGLSSQNASRENAESASRQVGGALWRGRREAEMARVRKRHLQMARVRKRHLQMARVRKRHLRIKRCVHALVKKAVC